ncbi:MAG: hypothetical protein EBS90_07745 [Betaproteobacteria bacterium]|nr:hypothetical protein [Betaproteobacteria bacterium]
MMDNLDERLLELRDGVRGMGHGDPDDPNEERYTAVDVIDAALAELRRLRSERENRKPLAWLCRDGDGKRIIYIAPCRTKKEALAITEARGYAIEPIPVYGE